MRKEQIMMELFGFSAPTYYKWSKHEKRKIFHLLNYAFSDDELIEFIQSNKIQRIENAQDDVYQLLLATRFYKQLQSTLTSQCLQAVFDLLNQLYNESQNGKVNLEDFIAILYTQSDHFFSKRISYDSIGNDHTGFSVTPRGIMSANEIKLFIVKKFTSLENELFTYIYKNTHKIKHNARIQLSKRNKGDE